MSDIRCVLVATCLSAIATTPQVAAQERIEVIRNADAEFVFQEYSVGFTNFGVQGRTTFLPTGVAGGVNWVPMAGGRYLVGIAVFQNNTLIAFDRRTRSIVATLPTIDRVTRLIPDPIRPRFFYSTERGQVVGFDASTQSSWIVRDVQPPTFLFSIAYAPKVDRIFVISGPNPFTDPQTPRLVSVVNATSGSVENQFATTGFGGGVVDSAGRRFYLPVQGPTLSTTEIAAYDPETGQEVARAADPGELSLDEARGLLFGTLNAQLVTILDALSLATVQQVTIPRLPGVGNPRLTVQPGRLMSAAHMIQRTGSSGACFRQTTTTFNIDGGVRGTIVLSSAQQPVDCVEVILLEAPPSPSTLTGSVVGSNVHLRWENPGNVSEFELQVGLAPGATAASLRVGLETSIGVANVPPGVYYVRVRAINEIGMGPPSPEIRIDVH